MADYEEPLSDEEKVWRQFNSLLNTVSLIFREALVSYVHMN